VKALIDTPIFLWAITGDSRLSKRHRALFRQMENNRLTDLGIRPSHFTELESLPPLHRNPFDRMPVAQARAERLPVATVDPLLRRYGVKVV
jgi:PIN domain nuclease of toxin-antitoxin system